MFPIELFKTVIFHIFSLFIPMRCFPFFSCSSATMVTMEVVTTAIVVITVVMKGV